jgi:fructosamine-3-kinase
MNIVPIQRHGYGAQFNRLTIIDNQYIRKESKNEYGVTKIKKEIQFLQYIHNYHVPFSIPTMYEYGGDYYVMEYLKDYIPLYKYCQTASEEQIQYIVGQVRSELHSMHTFTKIPSDRFEIIKLLQKETNEKIYQRYQEIESIVHSYSSIIKTVNNVPIRSFDDIVQRIGEKVQEYVQSMTNFELCLIHGDCQFNNILYHPQTQDIVFIDPRGYFGDKDLFGMAEYDEAKILFALTGYDVFDNLDIRTIDIQGDNLILPTIFLTKEINLSNFIGALTISIWLGNAHCFKDNIPKAIYSFYYALYLGTLYL